MQVVQLGWGGVREEGRRVRERAGGQVVILIIKLT